MEPVKEGQGEETPVTVPAQGEPTAPVTETKENATPKKSEAVVLQSEWQMSQERLRALELANAQLALEKFESENPIVKTEKYKDKWAEIKKLKATPGHRYAGLDYGELLNLIRDTSTPPEPKHKVTPVPSMNPSASPDVPTGSMSETVKDFLSLRYTKDQIDSVKK